MDWGTHIHLFTLILISFGSILRPELERQKVIIVDKDPDTLHITDRIMNKLAFEVFSFDNPLEALEKATFVIPDILIYDISTGGENKLEFIANMFTLFPELEVIIMGENKTGIIPNFGLENQNQFHKYHEIQFLPKPFGYNELRNKLIKIVN